MTQHSTSATDGQDGGHISTGLSEAISPEQFATACQQIVHTQRGDAAHRALDQLVTSLLSSLGYGDGMAIFVAHVAPYHSETCNRPGFAPCPTCGQYSHSLGDDALANAFMHFMAMTDHRGDGMPTQYVFDQATRDAAQVLMAQGHKIAAYLDQQADKCRQRAMSRAFRIAADDVRARLWEETDNG